MSYFHGDVMWQEEYTRAVNTLREREQDSGLAQTRAQKLLEKASQLSLNTTDKLKQLKGDPSF